MLLVNRSLFPLGQCIGVHARLYSVSENLLVNLILQNLRLLQLLIGQFNRERTPCLVFVDVFTHDRLQWRLLFSHGQDSLVI